MRRAVYLHVDLEIPASHIGRAIVFVLLLVCAPELGSEAVNLTTYYPSPGGIYAGMMTTGTAYLSTVTGAVGVGTTSIGTLPAGRVEKLDVRGYLCGESVYDDLVCAGSDGSNPRIVLTNATRTTLAFWNFALSNRPLLQAGDIWVQSPGKVGINVAPPAAPNILLQAGSAGVANIRIRQSGCYVKAYATVNNTLTNGPSICTNTTNEYATNVAGVWSKLVTVPENSGNIICCPCGGACPL